MPETVINGAITYLAERVTMWLPILILLSVIFFALAILIRPQAAIGVSVALAFALPIWILLPLFDIPGTVVGTGIDPRLGIGIVGLIGYCFFRKSTYPAMFTPCDFAMLGLTLVHAASDIIHQGPNYVIPLRIYAEWYVPYVAGRLAFQYRSDLERLTPILTVIAAFLACTAIFEGLTHINPFEVFERRPPEQVAGDLKRWGLYRAFGPCLNPIYFGVLQLLLLPWPSLLAWRAIQGNASKLWLAIPFLCVAGIVCTGSRAALLGIAIAIASMLFWLIPRTRLPLVIVGCLILGILVFQRERALETIESWASESQRIAPVQVSGTKQEYSAARNRLILFDLYRIALRRSGLFGFGTDAVTGFPVQVPVGEQESETLRRIRFIDNTYILITLRFGYLGLLSFSIALLSAIFQFYYLSQKHLKDRRDQISFISMYATMMGSFGSAAMIALLTVWMPPEHGFVLLWIMGASSGMLLADQAGQLSRTNPKPIRKHRDKAEEIEADDEDDE